MRVGRASGNVIRELPNGFSVETVLDRHKRKFILIDNEQTIHERPIKDEPSAPRYHSVKSYRREGR